MKLPAGEVSSTPIKYEPVSVKDLLVEMKDTAELMIDLAYSAVLHQSDALADEVIQLEHRMGILELRAQMSLLMAARSPDDAEQLAPVLSIVTATDQISDAAGDIAKIVREEIGLPDAMRAALPEAVETLVRGVVDPDSDYAGRTLGDIDLESETGVRVIALRRGEDWLLNPGRETEITTDDIALLRGPESEMEGVYNELTGESYEPAVTETPAIDDLERAVDTIVHMKNLSELAVDLAYSSVLFDDVELAEEVRNLEVEVDNLESRFEAWVLEAAADAEDPVSLRGLIHLGTSTEVISDAALDISEGVIRQLTVHPVVHLAVKESDEIISRTEVAAGSELDGTSVTNGIPDADATMSIIAIRRPEEGWLLVGDTDVVIQGGDSLIAKGTRTAGEAFESMAEA
ncbi:potassium channel family protein [Halonotius terrestris]|uniref:Potassium channel family protein n=1 Tax=Halonotius terrestris TaxID=2487750 RepID=A0A8J8PEG8_9EURY|nr:potassium channel family protein [Halonotius terrestris]TQQ83810.1 potassium channel family protein [Halonotius terrestris]